jgi:hypothetical protein
MDNELYFELVKAWETPRTYFYATHYNTAKTWGNLLGITEEEFLEEFNNGSYAGWFKIMKTPFLK